MEKLLFLAHQLQQLLLPLQRYTKAVRLYLGA